MTFKTEIQIFNTQEKSVLEIKSWMSVARYVVTEILRVASFQEYVGEEVRWPRQILKTPTFYKLVE